MDPSNAQAEVALGAALALLGDRDAGIARMRHGIKLSPRDRMLGFWGWALGLFLLHANRAGEALEEARIAARRDPRLHLPLVVEAVAQETLGRTELARAALMSANASDPNLRRTRSKSLMAGTPPEFLQGCGTSIRQRPRPQGNNLLGSSANGKLDVAFSRNSRLLAKSAF
jgi:tetratricopeptide (TPR) repeat protein